ncbi:hypothetical protein NL108_009043 [Boleophthalmus pectinirostris]|nr:hypothetical protein NL108_009043 [Boleophthalmus pectinirostris]
MERMSVEQLHRSTLEIYSHLLDEFNPSLHRLVSLGDSYVQAFQALAVKSEAYFTALSRMGERAFHSHALGDVLIQMSESQRKLTTEVEGIYRWFQVEVLQEMDNNVRMDIDYIAGSKKRYEMEVHSQAVALERQHRRDRMGQDMGEHMHFLRDSHHDALEEEERRYRFLAEKHCALIQSFSRLMNKTGAILQQRAEKWTEEVSATRRQEPRKQPAEILRGREELGSIPSRAPSPENRPRLGSVTDSQGGGGGRAMRALASHKPSSANPTLLPFNRGELISVLVPQSKNGWLFGRAESSARTGWFPASYVESLDDPPKSAMSSNSSLRSSSSMSSLYSQSGSSTHSQAPPPPGPPPPPSPGPPPPPSLASLPHTSNKHAPPANKSQPRSPSESKGPEAPPSRPELFPRGTNPFATVKLKPTKTNDRSAPKLRR